MATGIVVLPTGYACALKEPRELIDRTMRTTREWIDAGRLTRLARARELAAHHHPAAT